MKAEILKMLRQSDGYLSGQQLCDHFQVSRTAVWKAINQLKEEGYEIEAVRNKGYRIVDIPDRIQLRAWKISGHGCIWCLGRYDHGSVRTWRAVHPAVPKRQMDRQKGNLTVCGTI